MSRSEPGGPCEAVASPVLHPDKLLWIQDATVALGLQLLNASPAKYLKLDSYPDSWGQKAHR